jgi:hypothetical protein
MKCARILFFEMPSGIVSPSDYRVSMEKVLIKNISPVFTQCPENGSIPNQPTE